MRFNPDGSVSRCGHMVGAPRFATLADMEASSWLLDVKHAMLQNDWPQECTRCQTMEQAGATSIRQHAVSSHEQNALWHPKYLLLGGVLDNICNSACQTCNANLSTKIGSLTSGNYIKINNRSRIESLPLDRIIQLDINGGEPSASPNYLALLDQLPDNVRRVRVNTNGGRPITKLGQLVKQGIEVTVTVSLDGTDLIHDYVRWPIKYSQLRRTVAHYQELGLTELNFWTTVSALNIGDFKNIQTYAKQTGIKHAWALLEQPDVLNIKYKNALTTTADVPPELAAVTAVGPDNSVELGHWITQQDQLRAIRFQDYYTHIDTTLSTAS